MMIIQTVSTLVLHLALFMAAVQQSVIAVMIIIYHVS
jgi:hypothetical protein